jgi:hypothetical protein
MAADINEVAVIDFIFADNFQPLPGGWLIKYKELKAFREFKDFYVSDPEGKKTFINMDESINECFIAYYDLWENYHYFGLPHGKGWINELPWVVDFLKHFEKVYK